MKRPMRLRLLVAVGGLGLLASACGTERPLNTLDPAGPNAKIIDDLFNPIFFIAVIVFVLVQGVLIVIWRKFGVKGAESSADERPGTYADDVFPEQVHGNFKLEIGWTIVPAVFLAIVSVLTLLALFELEEVEAADDDLRVTVVGNQWWWEFQYHLDGNVETAPDFVTANEMVIPVDVEVPLWIESRDVIHSFWIPRLNGKKDAVPGRSHPWVIEASELGRFAGQCTEFCGLSHAYMQMYTEAVTQSDFDAWVAQQLTPQPALTEGDDNVVGQELFVTNCSRCHMIVGVTDTNGDEEVDGWDIYDGDSKFLAEGNLTAGAAPNLTHLMSRETFAGSFFDLYDESGEVNRDQLEAWVRNAPGEKPARNENLQGMPSFAGLSPEDLNAIVDYLETLQ